MRLAPRLPMLLAAGTLAACASAPPPPDWQLNAKGALERAASAYLAGNSRVEAVEFARARAEVARTGRPDLLATLELNRCAWRVASLVFEDCAGFAPLAQDAGPAERDYAAYLAGTGRAPAALAGIEDPLSKLVAAGVLLRSGRADPATFRLAADTASAQGWSRPLLAWLQAALLRAEAGGDAEEAARLKRRIGHILGGPARPA